MQKIVILISLFVVLSGVICYAGEPIALSLDEAVKIGFKNSPIVFAAKNRIEAANARLKARKAVLPNPELTVSGVLGDAEEKSQAFVQEFEIAGQRSFRVNKAKSELEIEIYQAQEEYIELFGRIANAYYSLAKARELVTLYNGFLKDFDDSLAVIKKRYEAGNISKIPLLQFEMELTKEKLAFLKIKQEEEEAGSVLATLLFGTNNQVKMSQVQLKISSGNADSKINEKLLQLKEYFQIADKFSPSLKEAEVKTALSGWEEKLSKSEQAPKLFASIYRSSFERRPEAQGTSLSIVLPLWDYGKNKELNKSLQLEKTGAEYFKKQILQEVQLNIAKAHSIVSEKQSLYQLFTSTTLANAEQLYLLTKKGFDFGAVSYLELLEASRTFREAKILAVALYYDLKIALLELDKSSGNLINDIPLDAVQYVMPDETAILEKHTLTTGGTGGGVEDPLFWDPCAERFCEHKGISKIL